MAAVNDRATFGRDSVCVLQSRNRKSVSQRVARHRLISFVSDAFDDVT